MKEAKELLIGKTVVDILVHKEYPDDSLYSLVRFECSDGTQFVIDHYQECCEDVYLENTPKLPALPFEITEIVESNVVSDSEDCGMIEEVTTHLCLYGVENQTDTTGLRLLSA